MLQRWNEKNTVSEERKKEKNVRKEITEQQCLNSVSTRQAAIVVSKRTKRERRHRQRPQKQNFESIFLNNKKNNHQTMPSMSSYQWNNEKSAIMHSIMCGHLSVKFEHYWNVIATQESCKTFCGLKFYKQTDSSEFDNLISIGIHKWLWYQQFNVV